MDEELDFTVNIFFCIPEYNIPRKTYKYSKSEIVRELKNQVLAELDHWGISLSENEIINYSFALVDFTYRPVRFALDHSKVFSLYNSEDGVVNGYLCFMLKSRLSFPIGIRSDSISQINKEGKRKKFLQMISIENINEVEKYLLKGIDPNFCDYNSYETPLFVWGESLFPSEQILSLLISHGAHLDFRVPSGHSIIHKAILTENFKSIKLLHKYKVSLEELDGNGVPAFFYALNPDIHILCIELLLELGVDFNSTDLSNNNNIFHHCCKHGLTNHLGVIISYINNHPDRDELIKQLYRLNNSGNTPLHVSVLNKQRGCVELLLQCGINVNTRNYSKDTAHELAVRNNDYQIKKLFEAYSGSFSTSTTLYTCFDTHSFSPRITFKRGTLRRASIKSNSKFKSATCLKKNDKQSYPCCFKAVYTFVSSSKDELDVLQNDIISVYVILQTRIAFGSKIAMDGKLYYGWFPSPCIGIKDLKEIESFRNNVSSVDRLVLTIPFLSSVVQDQQLPILIAPKLSSRDHELGIELGYKYFDLPWNLRPISSVTMQASPVYVRQVLPDSPADLAGLRVGDQILMISNIDVTTLKLKTIVCIIKSLCKERIPDEYPRDASKQLLFLVSRNNDSSLCLADLKNSKEKNNHCENFLTPSTSCTLNQNSQLQLSENQTIKTQCQPNIQKSFRRRYHVPLPPIPIQSTPDKSVSILEDRKIMSDNECSVQDQSSDDLPLPPPELLQ